MSHSENTATFIPQQSHSDNTATSIPQQSQSADVITQHEDACQSHSEPEHRDYVPRARIVEEVPRGGKLNAYILNVPAGTHLTDRGKAFCPRVQATVCLLGIQREAAWEETSFRKDLRPWVKNSLYFGHWAESGSCHLPFFCQLSFNSFILWPPGSPDLLGFPSAHICIWAQNMPPPKIRL